MTIYNSTQTLLKAMADALCEHGLDISCPWDGDLTDLEQERFDGLVAVLDVVEAKHPKIASTDELLKALKDALRSSREGYKAGPDGDRQHREAHAEQFAAITKACS